MRMLSVDRSPAVRGAVPTASLNYRMEVQQLVAQTLCLQSSPSVGAAVVALLTRSPKETFPSACCGSKSRVNSHWDSHKDWEGTCISMSWLSPVSALLSAQN